MRGLQQRVEGAFAQKQSKILSSKSITTIDSVLYSTETTTGRGPGGSTSRKHQLRAGQMITYTKDHSTPSSLPAVSEENLLNKLLVISKS